MTYCRYIRVFLNIPGICRGFSFAVFSQHCFHIRLLCRDVPMNRKTHGHDVSNVWCAFSWGNSNKITNLHIIPNILWSLDFFSSHPVDSDASASAWERLTSSEVDEWVEGRSSHWDWRFMLAVEFLLGWYRCDSSFLLPGAFWMWRVLILRVSLLP